MTAVVYQCADRAHSSQQWPLRTASTCSSDWNDLPMSSFMDSKVVPTVIVHMQADGTFKTLASRYPQTMEAFEQQTALVV
eukprot:scaffold44_cov411-Prasinococcus_capsulatus_cf.AAC.32